MTYKEKLDKATKEAYHDIADDVITHVEDFLEDIIAEYRFIDFTDETFRFINDEQFSNDNKHIVHDIIKPAESEIMRRIKMVLLSEEF